MSKYSGFSKEELIHRIEVLESGMTFYEISKSLKFKTKTF